LSVQALMVCILVLALAIAALRSASSSWVSAMFSMTLGLLLTAVLGVVYRHGSRRAFWLGFALFGWVYWLMSFGPWFDTWVATDLLLTRPIKALSYAMHPPPVFEGTIQLGSSEDFASRASFQTLDNFWRIGKSLAVLVVALLGGFVAVGFSWEASRRSDPPVSPKVSTR
jgi:hypothetical protein